MSRVGMRFEVSAIPSITGGSWDDGFTGETVEVVEDHGKELLCAVDGKGFDVWLSPKRVGRVLGNYGA